MPLLPERASKPIACGWALRGCRMNWSVSRSTCITQGFPVSTGYDPRPEPRVFRPIRYGPNASFLAARLQQYRLRLSAVQIHAIP